MYKEHFRYDINNHTDQWLLDRNICNKTKALQAKVVKLMIKWIQFMEHKYKRTMG